MSPLGQHLFEQAAILNQAASVHIKLGREQFCEEVRRILGTASARKPLDVVVQELIELCNQEVRP